MRKLIYVALGDQLGVECVAYPRAGPAEHNTALRPVRNLIDYWRPRFVPLELDLVACPWEHPFPKLDAKTVIRVREISVAKSFAGSWQAFVHVVHIHLRSDVIRFLAGRGREVTQRGRRV